MAMSTTVEPNFFFIYTLNAYDLHERLNANRSQQLLLIKNFAASKSCGPNCLLQIGLHASQGPHSYPEVATFALNTCLSALLASPSPDYQYVALTVRKLIAVCAIHKGDTHDDVVYGMYKQAYRIMVGLKAGEYPIEEGKWLAMTALNRAALPVRLGQVEAARKWMSVGLELAGKVMGMDTYKSCMEDFLAGFGKGSHGHDNGEISFDGNSMKVAELLFKNGFKEAFAIRGGVRGKNGWQAIQETLLPPSVHIYPKKKVKISQQPEVNGRVNTKGDNQITSSSTPFTGPSEKVDNGYVIKATELNPRPKDGSGPLSPYPNFPDMKPPSSPTPSKP